MAIFIIGDSFHSTEGGSDRNYQPYYDSGTGIIYFETTGTGTIYSSVSEMERGQPNGTVIAEYCNGTTKITGKSSTTTPFATILLEANSPDCAYVPPGDTCDIAINSITKTDETSAGANDGTLTVNASTGHSPLQYSLDGTTFQSSNFFSGIAPGNYTVYVKDALLYCSTSTSFTINAYNVPVQNFTNDLPVVTIGANTSRWNAAFNPIYITYQRRDFTINSVVIQNANQVRVTLALLLTGDQISAALMGKTYVKTALYEIYGVAVSHTIVAGFSVLVFDQLYLADDTTGFININLYKQGYEIETELTFGDNAYNRTFIVCSHSPDYKGQTRADISGFLKTQLSTKDNFNYIDPSYKDANLGQSYTVRFREAWGGSQSQWYAAPYPLYFTYAAMQLGEQYGGNMAQYVPFMTTVSQSQKAKFLTDWESPIMWGGLPFELSFIYSENVINEQLYIELVPDCGSTTNSLLINADAGLITNVDASRFIISQAYNPAISGFAVIRALGVTRVLIPDVFDCCAKNIKANIYYGTPVPPTVFNYEFIEGGAPSLQMTLNINGHVVTTPGSGSYTSVAGSAYNINVVANSLSGTNPTIRLQVKKDTVTIFDERIPISSIGDSLAKAGISQPNSTYDIFAQTADTITPVTPIDIADNTPFTGGVTYIMQDINIKHECQCDDPYIYIKWLNSRGAWDYYRFGFNQSLNASISNDVAVTRYVQNWETSDTIEDNISKSSIRQLKVGADGISEDEANALQWAKKSIKAMMLVNTNPVKWQTVIIKDGDTDSMQTRNRRSNNARFTLLLPSDNLQTQ